MGKDKRYRRRQGKGSSNPKAISDEKVKIKDLPAMSTLMKLGYQPPKPNQYASIGMTIALTNGGSNIILKVTEEDGELTPKYKFREGGRNIEIHAGAVETYFKPLS